MDNDHVQHHGAASAVSEMQDHPGGLALGAAPGQGTTHKNEKKMVQE